MHLSELTLENLRACRQTRVRLRPEVTVLTGRNDTGKTTVLDALRLLTEPLDGRCQPILIETDRTHDADGDGRIRLNAVLDEIKPEHAGTYRDALLPGTDDTGVRRACWTMTYTPPPAGTRRGRTTWYVGEGRESPGEPTLRTAIRHAHLPATRDPDREIDGPAAAARLRVMLETLLSGNADTQDQLLRAAWSMMDVTADDTLSSVRAAVNRPLAAITAGSVPRQAGLATGAVTLREIGRMLRTTIGPPDRPLQPATASGTGLAQVLYLATVLAEIETAREADLTLLLIDGPETHLHPELHTPLLRYLNLVAAASRRRDQDDPALPAGQLQVVVTTHAPTASAAVSVRDMAVMTRSGNGPVTAVAVADLGVTDRNLRRLDRYLSLSRSSLLYSTSVALVATAAEATLLSALAERVLVSAPADNGDEALARFQTTTVVAASDVDPDLVLSVLLAENSGARIGQRIAVLTGTSDNPVLTMPPLVSIRRLSDIPGASTDSVRGFAVGEPIWGILMCPDNEPVLYQALLDAAEDGEHRWQAVIAKTLAERQSTFQNLFCPGLRGEPAVNALRYANALADLLADGAEFTVPASIADSIRFLANAIPRPGA